MGGARDRLLGSLVLGFSIGLSGIIDGIIGVCGWVEWDGVLVGMG